LCAAIRNCTYLELLGPVDDFAFGLASPLPVENGVAHLPQGPGLGIVLDWNGIENDTMELL
jgi:L-alanine-DL-glutamate epimerase-like enolase superfamily enzyme